MTTGNWARSSGLNSVSKTWSGGDGRSSENNYSCTFVSSSDSYFRLHNSWNNAWQGNVSAGALGVSPTGPVNTYWDELTTLALKRLMGRYKNHDFNAGTFLAEAPETYKMVTKAGLSIFSAYRDVRKGRFGKALSTLRKANLEKGRTFYVDRNAASAWLSLQFGWIPLIGDAYDAVDAYSYVRETSRKTRIRASTKRVASMPNTAPWFYVARKKILYRVQVILKTTYRPSEYEQLGLTSPALIAWELLPFSFIVDYFYKIGEWLELNSVLPKSDSLYITTQSYVQVFGGVTTPGPPLSTYDRMEPASPSYYSRYVYVKRTVSPTANIPPPRVTPVPGLKQMANMLALGTSLLR